ncbi:MAG: type II toxin-antitoxin system VapC family toxin, partial [Agrobacterium tumefaciens]
ELRKIINDDQLLCHPFVVGELALGNLRERAAVLEFLAAQREALIATHAEVMTIIDRHSIFSMGIGYTDAHLLTSTLLDRRSSLWTRDKRLAAAAQKVGVALYTHAQASR